MKLFTLERLKEYRNLKLIVGETKKKIWRKQKERKEELTNLSMLLFWINKDFNNNGIVRIDL